MFKAGGKTFCTFEVMKGRPSIAFRLDGKAAADALKDVRCFASPYGRGLWVSVWVDEAVDWKLIVRPSRSAKRPETASGCALARPRAHPERGVRAEG